MRKLISIFFLLSFLSAHTAFGEALKLPLLIHHYIEHSQQGNFSVSDFLSKHYGVESRQHHNDQHHDHENLPFKATNTQVATNAFLPHSIAYHLEINIRCSTTTPSLQPQKAHQGYFTTVWQPPQIS